MDDRALELKVGLVLLAGIAILVGFLLLLGDFHLEPGMTVKVDFVFSGAVQEGAPVRISGVKVGRVREVIFVGGEPNASGEPIQVRLVLSLEDRVRPVLRTNTEFFVSREGLIGESFVELVPHRGDAAPLENGAIVRGVDPARMELLMARLYDVLESTSEIMRENKGVVIELLRAAAGLSGTIDDVLKENRRDLTRTIQGAALTMEDAHKALGAVLTVVGDGRELAKTTSDVSETVRIVKRELPIALEKLQRALDETNRLTGALSGIERAQVEGAMKDASAALARANAVLGDVKLISERVRAGQGTVGLLVQDDEIYDDLKEVLRDIKQHPWKLIWKD